MTTICTICARGGSTGVPRKNVRELCGKPLIAHTIEQAQACGDFFSGIYVSTDDDEIAQVARDYGAIVPFKRPAHMATKEAGKGQVIVHLVEHLVEAGVPVTRVVDLDPTSPLRIPQDIMGTAAMLDADTDVVFTGYKSDKNPYFNMVEAKSDGNIRLVKTPEGSVLSRQAAPPVYAINGSVYVWHRHTVAGGLWSGRTKLYEMPHERSVDIDAEIDFKLVELLMTEARAKTDGDNDA